MARIALVAALVAVVAACGSSSPETAGNAADGASTDKATLTLYSGQHEQTTDAMVAAFTRQTGIKVKVRADDEDVLAAQIAQEGSRSPADVFYTENSPPLVSLTEKHLLAPIEASTLAEVPSRYNSPSGAWVGVSARVATIVYNTNALKPADLPTTMVALSDPKWKGKLAIAPGETDFQPIVTSIAKAKGTAFALQWLKGVKANGAAHTYPDNETIVADVNSGRAQLGIINHYYWFRLRAEIGAGKMHSALDYLAPHDVGYVLDVSGAGVLASSKHQAEAQELAHFLVSARGEKILANSDSFEYPVGSGVAANPQLRPFTQLMPNSLTIAQLGDGSEAVNLLQEAQLL